MGVSTRILGLEFDSLSASILCTYSGLDNTQLLPNRCPGTSTEPSPIKTFNAPIVFNLHAVALLRGRFTMASSIISLLRAFSLSLLVFFPYRASAQAPAAISGATVSSTILVIARDQTAAQNGAASGLQGYGIPYEILAVPQAGISDLPVLNASATHGNYGGIVVLSEVGYNYDNQYYSALTRVQWNALFSYQTLFGVRMVRLDVFPTSDFGTVSLGGSINDEPVSFTNVTSFQTAGLKT